jgi:hypothetical protein
MTGKSLTLAVSFARPKISRRTSPPPCETSFAVTVNRTKTFHVKHFGPIRASNRTILISRFRGGHFRGPLGV